MKLNRVIKYSEAIRESLLQSMNKNKKIILMGLGITDPKGVFGTTVGLERIFGADRVLETPTSENAMTGIAIGASIQKFPVVLTHQRVEFSLLSMEQIINQAAKWFFMSAGQKSIPIVIRLIIGRGWGQGPQHSQSLEVLFSHIPGLKVICPSNAYDAKGLLNASIIDPNPIIFFEHRWLHDTTSYVPSKFYLEDLNKAKVIKKGTMITLISFSYGVISCIKSFNFLKKNNISAEILDLRVLNPIDKKTILKSVKKTGRVIIVDNGWTTYGVSAEIMSLISENIFPFLKEQPYRIGNKQTSMPSTRFLAKYCYINEYDICKLTAKILKKNINLNELDKYVKDVPDNNFRGPF